MSIDTAHNILDRARAGDPTIPVSLINLALIVTGDFNCRMLPGR
jgi:hypothetical protein